MCSPADEPIEVIELPTEHFLRVNVNEDGGESLSIDIPLVVNERGYPEIKGKTYLEKEKGDSGLFTRIRLELKSPEHCIGCGALLSGAPAELQFEVQVRTLAPEGDEPKLGEEVKACHECIRKALREPAEGLAGMPILFEAKAPLHEGLGHTHNCYDPECEIKGEHLRGPECIQQ
jgi:hypothetical protein